MPAEAKTKVIIMAKLMLINHRLSVHLPPRDFLIRNDESVPDDEEGGVNRP